MIFDPYIVEREDGRCECLYCRRLYICQRSVPGLWGDLRVRDGGRAQFCTEVAEGVGEDRHPTLFAKRADLATSRDQAERMMHQNAVSLCNQLHDRTLRDLLGGIRPVIAHSQSVSSWCMVDRLYSNPNFDSGAQVTGPVYCRTSTAVHLERGGAPDAAVFSTAARRGRCQPLGQVAGVSDER